MAGKNYAEAKKKVTPGDKDLDIAVGLMMESKYAKFDETAEIAINLGVDPKHADQMVRGTVVLPHGLGKQVRVCVIASGEKIKEAEEAGAEFVGGDDFVERIQGGWTDFDAVVATPDMMKSVETGQDPWSSWIDAQPEGRDGDIQCQGSGRGYQGR